MGRLADQKEVTFLPYSFSKFSKGNIGETPKKKFMSVASGQRLWHLKLPPEGGEAWQPALQSKTPAECVLDVG